MPSLIPGYEYDIFISYRQKDNRGERWVSEFVESLKTELESTFKEEISVYFDINPHDGLLETHDVGDSLKEKLKCLIFIPIISRTYCDPKSFAWEHEFKAFVEMASKDQLGLKVKLPNGNVASRVLPVRIYNLDNSDILLCESALGGVLRGIEFIYKSAGVNRPLRANEDHPHDNLNKTYYRDQINKVANAVKEIVFCFSPLSNLQISREYHTKTGTQEFSGSLHDSHVTPVFEEVNSEPIRHKLYPPKNIQIILFLSIFILGILALWGWLRTDSGSFTELPTHSTIPVESTLMDSYGQYPYFSISPDGRTIATGSDKGIQLRSLSDFTPKILEGTEKAGQIAFSPGGESIVFEKGGSINKININGTQKSVIYNHGPGPGLFWGTDGYVYFSPGFGQEGIWRILSNGGEPEKITSVIDSLGENSHRFPQLLPDSKTLIYTALGPSNGSLDSKIVLQDLNTGNRKVLVDKATFGRYLFNGNILYANNEGYIFVIPFDLRKLKTIGESRTVLAGVNTASVGGAAFLSVSATGNLIFLPPSLKTLNIIDVVDRSGNLIRDDSVSGKTLERFGYGWSLLTISPSGKYLAITSRSFSVTDIWLLDLNSGETERITFDPTEDEYPVWSPDGNYIAYTSSWIGANRRLFIKDLGIAGSPRLVRTWPRHLHLTSWSSDGKWLAAYNYTSTQGTDCYAISVDSDKYISLAAGEANEINGIFSPNGKWLAYQSDQSGRSEIYVISFPGLESKRQISEEGGSLPRWDHNGRFIYYLSNNYLIAHPVDAESEFRKGKPEKLFFTNLLSYDVAPDGQKFFLVRKNVDRPNPPLNLITNWFQELNTNKAH